MKPKNRPSPSFFIKAGFPKSMTMYDTNDNDEESFYGEVDAELITQASQSLGLDDIYINFDDKMWKEENIVRTGIGNYNYLTPLIYLCDNVNQAEDKINMYCKQNSNAICILYYIRIYHIDKDLQYLGHIFQGSSQNIFRSGSIGTKKVGFLEVLQQCN